MKSARVEDCVQREAEKERGLSGGPEGEAAMLKRDKQ